MTCFDRRAAIVTLAATADRRKSTGGQLNPAEFRGEVSGKVSSRLPYFSSIGRSAEDYSGSSSVKASPEQP